MNIINTVQVKRKLFDGYFSVGNPDAREVVLMVGSCRGIPHLNYMAELNERCGSPYLIYYIDPFDYHWDREGRRVDLSEALARAAEDPVLLSILARTTVFIHEYFQRFGLFNTDPGTKDGIYAHGLEPRVDVCLPNFHGRFILIQDLLRFDAGLRERVREGGPESVLEDVKKRGLESIEGFLGMCAKTTFPDFADYFQGVMHDVRLFWNNNHVTKHFTVPLFRRVAEALGRPQPDAWYDDLLSRRDMYDSAEKAVLTRWDVEMHGWRWPEKVYEEVPGL